MVKDHIANQMTDAGYREIFRRIQDGGSTQAGTYSYRDENGEQRLVVCKFLKDRGRDHPPGLRLPAGDH